MTYTPKHAPLNQIPMEILSARDYEAAAPQFLADPVFAYLSGGSGDEQTLEENRQAFNHYRIFPRLLKNVADGHTRLELFQQSFEHPVFLAPVAYQHLTHPEGELATAQAANATDSCMVCSTLSSVSLDEVAQQAGENKWFQLYFQRSREQTLALLRRAEAAGYKAIVVTLDAAIQYPSARAYRAGFQMPDDIKAINLPDTPTIENSKHCVFEHHMKETPNWSDLEWLMENSFLPIIVKGVLNPKDARTLEKLGTAGIIVSNHGGRILDGMITSLEALPAIRQAVSPTFPILLDSGIRSGSDIFKALALGANAVMIGRLQVYALSVAGALGVGHMIKLLRQELEMCMALCGCAHLSDVKPSHLYTKP